MARAHSEPDSNEQVPLFFISSSCWRRLALLSVLSKRARSPECLASWLWLHCVCSCTQPALAKAARERVEQGRTDRQADSQTGGCLRTAANCGAEREPAMTMAATSGRRWKVSHAIVVVLPELWQTDNSLDGSAGGRLIELVWAATFQRVSLGPGKFVCL